MTIKNVEPVSKEDLLNLTDIFSRASSRSRAAILLRELQEVAVQYVTRFCADETKSRETQRLLKAALDRFLYSGTLQPILAYHLFGVPQ